jgi:hypothetical protein
VGDQQDDARHEHELRPREAEGLDLVPAHEFDAEPEGGGGQQEGLQEVARHRHARTGPDEDRDRHQVEADLVQHRRVHRQGAVRAAGERRRGRRVDGHPPRQRRGRPERQLREEAADPADRRGDRQREDVGVAGGTRVAEQALREHAACVAADERADDAPVAVQQRVRDRHARVDRAAHLVEALPAGDESGAEHAPQQHAQRHEDDPLLEPAAAPELRVVDREADDDREQRQRVVRRDRDRSELPQDGDHGSPHCGRPAGRVSIHRFADERNGAAAGTSSGRTPSTAARDRAGGSPTH